MKTTGLIIFYTGFIIIGAAYGLVLPLGICLIGFGLEMYRANSEQ